MILRVATPKANYSYIIWWCHDQPAIHGVVWIAAATISRWSDDSRGSRDAIESTLNTAFRACTRHSRP